MKQMQKESRCRMYIRGRGSLKFKDSQQEQLKANLPGNEHLKEELHVLVEYDGPSDARASCLKRAEEMVRELLVPPPSDDQDDLKKQQLRELAILNGTFKENKTLQACSNRRVSSGSGGSPAPPPRPPSAARSVSAGDIGDGGGGDSGGEPDAPILATTTPSDLEATLEDSDRPIQTTHPLMLPILQPGEALTVDAAEVSTNDGARAWGRLHRRSESLTDLPGTSPGESPAPPRGRQAVQRSQSLVVPATSAVAASAGGLPAPQHGVARGSVSPPPSDGRDSPTSGRARWHPYVRSPRAASPAGVPEILPSSGSSDAAERGGYRLF